jgi:hypothetical protein
MNLIGAKKNSTKHREGDEERLRGRIERKYRSEKR